MWQSNFEPIQPYGTKDLIRFKALKGCLFKSKLRKDFDAPSQIGLDYFELKILLIHKSIPKTIIQQKLISRKLTYIQNSGGLNEIQNDIQCRSLTSLKVYIK